MTLSVWRPLDCLPYLLQCRGYALSKPADLEAVRGLKEGLCYVAQDTAQEAKVGVRAEGGQCLGGWEASRWSRIHRMRPLGRRKGVRDRGGLRQGSQSHLAILAASWTV